MGRSNASCLTCAFPDCAKAGNPAHKGNSCNQWISAAQLTTQAERMERYRKEREIADAEHSARRAPVEARVDAARRIVRLYQRHDNIGVPCWICPHSDGGACKKSNGDAPPNWLHPEACKYANPEKWAEYLIARELLDAWSDVKDQYEPDLDVAIAALRARKERQAREEYEEWEHDFWARKD